MIKNTPKGSVYDDSSYPEPVPWIAYQECTALTAQQGSTEPSNDALRIVLHSRRHRKTSINGGDVWPEHLEAALLEGLEKYIPDDSRESRMLGRYRGRNKFVSREIFRATGERRSSKQVGSRIQQLKHCSTGRNPKIKRLLDPSSFRQPVSRESFSHVLNADYISASAWNFARSINISLPRPPIYSPLHLSYQLQLHGVDSVHIQANPSCRQVGSSAPIVTFISASPIYAVSSFTVYFDGRAVHTEGVTMTTRRRAVQGMPFQQFQLSAALVPAYWKTITDSPGRHTGMAVVGTSVPRYKDVFHSTWNGGNERPTTGK
ncbi:hypothetical protein GGX14DRAFT_395975 [Mycena pura]|uniref:TEA domain-containing protein n=1 Tax=Mycena pura TaxID=153505 RepID=A0AAD6VC28_9AGAR|nr:hypothetical protein GGX14DRAFT_395975 [Mycena pura]